ncbi:hypothetical protein FGO68_gene13027 [Halteria grandinella]|uniref:EF-hand domain-containing protein n=1 Tax=Halteria grandinella TaxID=5974 RepID=A0A8J8NIE6_HALGN|nr:hypothetical protein FGO68_gene13027 [Halteria grandinella]
MNLRPLTFREEREMRHSFELYDLKGQGYIVKEDALKIMQVLGYKMTKDEVALLNSFKSDRGPIVVSSSDPLPPQEISYDQFKEFYSYKLGKMSDKDKYKASFKLMDVDSKGFITVQNLKRVLNHELQLNISDQLLDDMLRECGSQIPKHYKDAGLRVDQVTEQQFGKMMKKYQKMIRD